ncbi:presenilin family intramembrane aspartyl protease PSH [Haloterrigena salifodinae]|uniref:presenilin family intramembrane aspartyl protease PSH n=1 Tax=Haloterrigena salifodinae TaxID=2675099 RepID=UPI000F86AAFB|nr:presenilin family intramembrane aspartyl protease PSH [Haloterrigena salifodinae]
MNDRTRVLLAVGFTVALFLSVQLGALALVEPFYEGGHQSVENPDDPTNSLVYFGIILVATALMLVTIKYDVEWLIKAMIIGVSVMISWYVFDELIPSVVTVSSVNVAAAAAAVAVGGALLLYPEWYVIDLTGVVMGAGAAALFGISFGLLPALLLLTVLAVYDAISVYGTEHMLELAEGVMALKIPVVLVVPTTLSFSYLDPESTEGVVDGHEAADAESVDDSSPNAASSTNGGPRPDDAPTAGETDADPAADGDDALERDALFIGLGDAVIPTVLVASAAYFLEVGMIDVPVITLNVPALGALLGTIAGLLVLMYMVLKGRPHAGLPLLNGGAIAGYLVGALASGLSLATALGL